MIFVALSSLQGRPQLHAYSELIKLSPDGIQLTPGNLVSERFEEFVKIPYRFHHGFSWTQYRRPVYDAEFNPIDIEPDRSIHPPKRAEMTGNFPSWIERMGETILEAMYPEYWLGNGEEIDLAMNLKKNLAVDISHLWIQKCQGTISETTIKKLLDYDRIREIHVSQNAGRFDSHRPIDKNTPWLGWAKEKERENKIPVIFESYLHKLNDDERKQQIELMRG